MSRAVYVNGRFAGQTLTGVQRFATEITRGLRRVWPTDRPPPVLLVPRAAGGADWPGIRHAGPFGGQLWEQAVLPRHATGGILVNLGNTAPLLAERQIVVIHDAGVFATPEAYSWYFRTWYALLQRKLARGQARVATVSAFARGEIGHALGIDAASVELLAEGADHMLRVAPEPDVLARYGLWPRRYVLVVGSLAAHKNLDALQATARMLAERGLDLVVAGGFEPAVFAAVRTRLPQPARYVGRVSDGALRALYAQAACFVFPSRYEGFGLPAVEAMACGCPVVAARAAALPEVCGDAALYCDPASPHDIARVVAALLDDPGLADALRARGAARAAAMTWDRAATELLAAIRRLEAAQ
ncbi:glycosyltransferase family 4 protein [Limobrevibacterium gyesilva]|uniref:Glycosyltransferase family 4 protein n=1 Tax=Limobrevibacterium gyesilva TaxID=2991712 RepID=A0AA41YN85_9PROT|nr:glycosyltransferase family 1 protein [Limobrevibacterium gyesilva]MCW3475477.1 glycosyltransferase family 4 protein [Limobrevibacterium gyesilva]